jgi:putative oxidoreductase
MKTFLAKLGKLHDLFFRYVSFGVSPFLLFVRLYWGWQLVQSGWGKLHNLDKVAEFFTSLNLPLPAQTALFIAGVEFFGGILLAIGLFSRLNALVLTVNMMMAYVMADREALFSIFSDPDKFTAAAPFTFLFASLLVLLLGPGKLALDSLLRRFAPFSLASKEEPYAT